MHDAERNPASGLIPLPYRPPLHRPVRADRPGITPRPLQERYYKLPEWQTLRRAVLARDKGKCRLHLPGCYHRATLADHVLARRDGGPDTMDNLVACCAACHNAKHGKRG